MVKSPYVRRAFAGRERLHSMQMVNARFPEWTPVWFRNGGYVQSTAMAGINRKFTPNHISRFFFANFRRFKFNATLAIYLRMLVKTQLQDNRKRCDESQRK